MTAAGRTIAIFALFLFLRGSAFLIASFFFIIIFVVISIVVLSE